MKPVKTTHQIFASPEKVFETISDVRNFEKAVAGIKKIEFLTEQQVGAGTRFKESREMHGKLQTVELEVTEYQPNERVRMVSDAGGAIWDTLFLVTPEAEGCRLQMTMEVRPYKVMAKLFTPLIMGMVGKAVLADMDAVKEFCESASEK